MAMGRDEWQVEEYERSREDVPVRTFVAGLEGRNANQAAALLLKLAARGNHLRPPDSQQVAENLFELRGHQVRIFYMFLPGRRVVLLDGIIKKQDRIPRKDLDRVRAYQGDVARRGPRAPY
jgi:hypothetical protein